MNNEVNKKRLFLDKKKMIIRSNRRSGAKFSQTKLSMQGRLFSHVDVISLEFNINVEKLLSKNVGSIGFWSGDSNVL